MGPQLDSCGRVKIKRTGKCPECSLQWGRNLTVAEGTKTTDDNDPTTGLQWGRNLTVAEGQVPPNAAVSTIRLQWGRNLTVAEGR